MSNRSRGGQHGVSGQRGDSHPELDGVGRFTKNSMQFKMYKFFISGISHLMFFNHDPPQVSESVESKTMDEKGLLNLNTILFPLFPGGKTCGSSFSV